MSTIPSVESGTYSPGPNMVCSSEQEKVGTGSIEAIICPVYSNLRIRATVSFIWGVCASSAQRDRNHLDPTPSKDARRRRDDSALFQLGQARSSRVGKN